MEGESICQFLKILKPFTTPPPPPLNTLLSNEHYYGNYGNNYGNYEHSYVHVLGLRSGIIKFGRAKVLLRKQNRTYLEGRCVAFCTAITS